MSETVNIIVDGIEAEVPKGLTVVDAAKMVAVDIPVFCHHPKLEPVGMCRMCLVDIGMPMFDRETREPVMDVDGTQKINWGRGMQTGCTVRVAEGMHVRTTTDNVLDARNTVIEFLLTSHPLDCPICDKGGECPLQNLTMEHGLGDTAFPFEDKMQNDKHVPLGDLIALDRERCIQCARCVRFQDEVVDDPVLGFHNRGRKLEIITYSNPGFDSYWSGNTTDICPVGALTTNDFRFGARPWELKPVASISPHGPEGENITMSTRQEAKSGGRVVIKRIMPRQNEQVNEIWISDRTRFGHHFADADGRLMTPMVRKNGSLEKASWDEALSLVADKLKAAGASAAGLTGDRMSNEDLFAFQNLMRKTIGTNNIDLANARIGGGDVIAQVGVGVGTNLGSMGAGDAIVVFASDLHEEAPIWWLRVKQAAQRGAKVFTFNVRETRLDAVTTETVLYTPGDALDTARALLNGVKMADAAGDGGLAAVAKAITESENVVAFYGYEGLNYDETGALARILANTLLVNGNVGKVGNGLIAVWPHNNTQGALDMGINPAFGPGYKAVNQHGKTATEIYADGAEALYIMGADPVGDGTMTGRDNVGFLIVQDLFLNATAELADVVLPAQSWAERDGTFTNGERRVQRYYPAIAPMGKSKADWQIIGSIEEKLGGGKPKFAASLVFKKDIAANVPQYKSMDYRSLAQVEKQYPDVGGEDLYYGGNSYENKHGLGQQWATAAESSEVAAFDIPDLKSSKVSGIATVRTAALYTNGSLLQHSELLEPRMAQPRIMINENDANGIATGDEVRVKVKGETMTLTAYVNGVAPQGVALLNGVPHMAGVIDAEITKG
ncbi:MAG: NADH-quinone oxidoreductase subunit NuoG [Chloroflexota bacterium]